MVQTKKTIAVAVLMAIATVGVIGTAATLVQHALASGVNCQANGGSGKCTSASAEANEPTTESSYHYFIHFHN